MGILLFDLKYMYIFLLLKMKNGVSWSSKIMVSPFKWKQNVVLDNYNYVCHIMCRTFRFEIYLSCYWENICFERNLLKFHVLTKIVILRVYLEYDKTPPSIL